jgi:two-component system, OmpR family, sensor kinase
MTAEPTLRHRVSTQARAVRTRIAAWVVLLTALALLGAGLAAYVVESDQVDRHISDAIRQEIAEFERLQRVGIDPRSGRPFTSAERLLEVALQRNVPDENETIVAYLVGRPDLVSGAAQPRHQGLARDPAFREAVQDLLPAGGSRRIETGLGEAVIAVKPVNDPNQRGAYVPVYFPAEERAEFQAVLRTYALVAGSALLLVTLGAWLAAGRLLRPVREMRATAQEISDTDLSRRITTTGNDDITDLGQTFNAMLDRIEQSFAQQRRFLDDAGHELRTPITIVRGHLELLDPDRAGDTEATRDLVLDEVDRMARLVDDMIVLAKSGRPDFLQQGEVDAGMLTDEVLDKVRALGDREWKLDERAEGTVCVDAQRVTQALVQLATNAVQHTAPGEVIAVGGAVDTEHACWWVRDTGPGIAPDDRRRIFERFQRGRDTRGSDGSGLGLSIVQAIAAAHGGDVLLDSAPGEGATFTLVVPRHGRPEHTEVR